MPIYEYRCTDCRKRTSQLVLSPSNPPALLCEHCNGANLQRIMSRFAAPKSEEARLESLADPSNLGGLDEDDPRSMARFMKKMGQEMGEDLGDDLDSALEEADQGGAGPESSDIE